MRKDVLRRAQQSQNISAAIADPLARPNEFSKSNNEPANANGTIQPFFPWGAETVWPQNPHAALEPGSRHSLIRVLRQAAAMGFGVGLEIGAEFFMLGKDEQGNTAPLQQPPQSRENRGWLQQMRSLLKATTWESWNLYTFDHEHGVGQLELSLGGANALTIADRYVFFRAMAAEIATQQGGFARFTPDSLHGYRHGAQLKFSLFAGASERNLFADGTGGASSLAGMFLKGLYDHLPSLRAFTAAGAHRQNAFAVPQLELALDETGVTLSGLDAGCDPYLLSALLLAAGLETITKNLDTGDPPGVAYYETLALGGGAPMDFAAALDAFTIDPVAQSVFGVALHRSWATAKREEWQQYRADTAQRRNIIFEKFLLPDRLRSV